MKLSQQIMTANKTVQIFGNLFYCAAVSLLLLRPTPQPWPPLSCLSPPPLQVRWLATTPALSSATWRRASWLRGASSPPLRPPSSATSRCVATHQSVTYVQLCLCACKQKDWKVMLQGPLPLSFDIGLKRPKIISSGCFCPFLHF